MILPPLPPGTNSVRIRGKPYGAAGVPEDGATRISSAARVARSVPANVQPNVVAPGVVVAAEEYPNAVPAPPASPVVPNVVVCASGLENPDPPEKFAPQRTTQDPAVVVVMLISWLAEADGMNKVALAAPAWLDAAPVNTSGTISSVVPFAPVEISAVASVAVTVTEPGEDV